MCIEARGWVSSSNEEENKGIFIALSFNSSLISVFSSSPVSVVYKTHCSKSRLLLVTTEMPSKGKCLLVSSLKKISSTMVLCGF